ncbi:aminodeoxychorismate synthase component I [Thioalkalivibrio sp. XN279]|uniref:aminodeoxychorismate synthase component I n=1 Tax=Thioalkalivibrio sp. XN279 TaxID=2714953 RepID=UPI00140E9617|nr:aminodeoxychorismate synthase component I [Thioalkalivibrio sp. XN279]NHA14455.1 aminodeoxychorismate synthase component I [Thioalkalivibrio sp. XN279]
MLSSAHRAAPLTVQLHDLGDLLALHRVNPARYPFLLESAASGTPQGRCDMLLGWPGESLVLDGAGRLAGPGAGPDDDFLRALDRWHAAARGPAVPPPGPVAGGWFVFLGYELAAQVEPSLRLQRPRHLPIALAVRCDVVILRNRRDGACTLSATDSAMLAQVEADLEQARRLSPPLFQGLDAAPEEEAPARFLAAVARAREYIIRGDIFQANLSRAWRVPLTAPVDPAALYAQLRRSNPGSFAGLACWDAHAVISSSPERLISIRDGWVETRPIAGTRPRGQSAADDSALEQELIAHPKERAEHVMLIDLERNDLGRICQPGTVEVNEMMVLESYAHVHHIVSNVRGRLEEGIGPGAAIRAVFPGGTITGCPKVRCMEIIHELEAAPRGAYTGSMGWLGLDGSLDLNILIRTMELGPDELRFRAGAGIVYDSIPELELAETRAKAKGLLLALEPGG